VSLVPIYIGFKTRNVINKQTKIRSMNKVIIFLRKLTSKSHVLAKWISARVDLSSASAALNFKAHLSTKYRAQSHTQIGVTDFVGQSLPQWGADPEMPQALHNGSA
jgi:hypothetical protein